LTDDARNRIIAAANKAHANTIDLEYRVGNRFPGEFYNFEQILEDNDFGTVYDGFFNFNSLSD